MDYLKLKNKKKLKDPPDLYEVNKASGVLKYFDSAFFLIKIYPSDNHSVKKSIDISYERITEFLNEYEKLTIFIEEFSFSYKGETIFQEEEKQNSLPFFFFSPKRMIFSHHFRQIKGHSYQYCPFNSIIYVQPGEIFLL